ncbi:endo-1,4-beta-xylanase [Serinicoccus kebangsaanensis]|uniref:endo-1,4-beta-xylanase n=1 Tax=Serinicoccus kebangsaanensis TaxID=2602069 RepID=UPI00124E08A5|nr:endo-1,4-beta-xylanase [Serinicoccus kebangsaanensis]
MHATTRTVLTTGLAAALLTPLAVAATASPTEPSGTTRHDAAGRDHGGKDRGKGHKDGLRREAPKDLAVGSAVWGQRDLLDQDRRRPTTYQRVLAREFSSLTPENDMKWAQIHPEPGEYDFSGADAVMRFARRNGQEVRGHTLLWHSQNPEWVSESDWSCAEARDVLEEHISTVVGRYAGDIYQWDVANEIFQDPSSTGEVTLRLEANPFLRACAEDPVALVGDAFRWAHEADPEAVLFLNDYNAEGINAKTDAYYALAQELLAEGVPLGGFGAQGHLSLQYGFDTSLQANLERFADLGLEVAVTEADVRVPLDPELGEPTAEQVQLHAERHDAMLQACIDVPACTSFTVWGFPDANSWVPDVFPGEDWATIFLDDFTPKPAYHAMLESLRDATPGRSPRGAHRR